MNLQKMRRILAMHICVFVGLLIGMPQFFALDINNIPVDQKPGTYPIEFNYTDENGNKHQQEITWTLTYPHTVISYDAKEAIDARDLIISSSSQLSLDAKSLITKMNASAWSLYDGIGIEITHVDVVAKKGSNTEYDVSFSTAKGTKTTVLLKFVTSNVLNLEEMYVYPKKDTNSNQFNRLFLFGGILILPYLYLVIVYIVSYFQTRKTNQLLYKNRK